jgi:3-dehydroquinate synthase
MAMAARFSARQGRISQPSAERLIAVLAKLGLPVEAPKMPIERWIEFMARDKKNRDGRMTLILLDALGRASIVNDTPAAEIEAFLAGA